MKQNEWAPCVTTHPGGLIFCFLDLLFALPPRLLLVITLLFLLLFLIVLLLLFRGAESAPHSFPRRQRSGGLQIDTSICRPVRVVARCIAVQSKAVDGYRVMLHRKGKKNFIDYYVLTHNTKDLSLASVSLHPVFHDCIWFPKQSQTNA